MAMKQLNTRIALRYDVVSKWEELNPVLKMGEVAIVKFEQSTIGNTDHAPTNTPPAIAMKVGDGVTEFKLLPYTQAIAGDVHAWAKADKKPDYTADDVEMVRGAVEAVLNDTTIDVHDTDTYYKITEAKVDGKHKVVFEAYKKDDTRDTSKDVTLDWSDLDTALETLNNNLSTLENTTMPNEIKKAIEALDGFEADGEGNFVVGISQVDGNVKATMGSIAADDIKNLIGLEDLTDFTEFEERVGAVETTLGHANLGNANTAIGETNKIATDLSVQEDIELALKGLFVEDGEGDYVTAVTQADGKITVTKDNLTSNKITDWQTAVTDKLDEKVDKTFLHFVDDKAPSQDDYIVLKSDIAELNGAMHFEGVVDTMPPAERPDKPYKSGDVVILANTTKEYVFNGESWLELGDEGNHATKGDISTLSTTLNKRIDDEILAAETGAIAVAVSALESKHDTFVNDVYTPYVTGMQTTIENMALTEEEITGEGTFVTTVTQTDGQIAVVRAKITAADLPNDIAQSQVTGLVDDLKAIDDTFAAANAGTGVTEDDYLATKGTVEKALEDYDTALRGALLEDDTLKTAPLHKVAVTGQFIDMESMEEDSEDYLFLNCGNASNFIRE